MDLFELLFVRAIWVLQKCTHEYQNILVVILCGSWACSPDMYTGDGKKLYRSRPKRIIWSCLERKLLARSVCNDRKKTSFYALDHISYYPSRQSYLVPPYLTNLFQSCFRSILSHHNILYYLLMSRSVTSLGLVPRAAFPKAVPALCRSGRTCFWFLVFVIRHFGVSSLTNYCRHLWE